MEQMEASALRAGAGGGDAVWYLCIYIPMHVISLSEQLVTSWGCARMVLPAATNSKVTRCSKTGSTMCAARRSAGPAPVTDAPSSRAAAINAVEKRSGSQLRSVLWRGRPHAGCPLPPPTGASTASPTRWAPLAARSSAARAAVRGVPRAWVGGLAAQTESESSEAFASHQAAWTVCSPSPSPRSP